MTYFLYGLFFLSCLVLVAAVLLQPGKTDAGALFTSNVSSSAFAPRGTATVLSKVTIGAAAMFMLSALLLSMPALTGNVSVLSSNPDAQSEAPSSNANANTTDTNTAGMDANVPAPQPANTQPDNGSLIETPATDAFNKQATKVANANAPAK
jgi:preprotein translocase subunit SecG